MQDLREWLKRVESLGELKEIRGANWDLEIGIITAENTRRNGPALLFDHLKDYLPGFRLLTTVLLSPQRIALTLNLPGDYKSEQEIVEVLEEKPSEWESNSPLFSPQLVEKAPVKGNILKEGEIDLYKIPAPRWHEGDGGRYIGTGCVVILKDPETERHNLGCYRMMLQNKDTLGLYISAGKHGQLIMEKYHREGRSCPVAVSLGHHPLLLIAATLGVPEGISEYNYAGAMGGESIEVTKGETTDLLIPAYSELVLEGECPSQERLPEGPFGEWTGYYAGEQKPAPIVKVKSILHRDNPIVIGCSPAARGDLYEVSRWFALFRSATLKKALRDAGILGVKGVWAHEFGGSRLFLVVSIKQEYAGQARQAGFVASQCREGAYLGRYVVVVDEDIDPTDIKEVLWAMCTRVDPVKDIDFIRRAWSSRLDPMKSEDSLPEAQAFFNTRAIIDACIPFERRKEFPTRNEYGAEIKKEVINRWKEVLGW